MTCNLPPLNAKPQFSGNYFHHALTRFYQILLILTLAMSIAGCTKLGVETVNQRTINSFDNSSVITVLNELIQVDIDTYHAYMHAANELKSGKTYHLLK